MQTGLSGVSMRTVRFTLLQGRKLFAPVPRGRHAQETKSKGTLALTQNRGLELAELLGAQGKYRRVLHGHYRDRTPAVPVNGRQDYGNLLRELEEMSPADSEIQGGWRESLSGLL